MDNRYVYRLTWRDRLWIWREHWSPYIAGCFIGWRGYAALLWHRLGCWLGWVPSHGLPRRPEKRWLAVPIDMSRPLGVGEMTAEQRQRVIDAGHDPQWWRDWGKSGKA